MQSRHTIAAFPFHLVRVSVALPLLLSLLAALVAAQCACEHRRDVLTEFYHATNGSGWNTTWDLSLPVCFWTGAICQVGDVTIITMPSNRLRGTLPASLANLTNLVTLELPVNYLSGTLSPEYSAWKKITGVYLAGNNLTGTLPPSYAAWGASILEFSVSTNSLSGTLPPQYSAWTNLGWISVGSNQMTGTLPPSYSAWKPMHQFSVFRNAFTGTLPPEYSAWSNMTNFYAYINQLSGTFPPEYSAWGTSMSVLEAYLNNLEGSLPPQYAAWKNLIRMNLGINRLTGILPNAYSAWTQMKTFIILNNSISGTLPASYSTWTTRNVLIFSHNKLQGPLPSAWSTWRSTPVLMFNNNTQLSGELPSTWTSGMMLPLSGYLSLCSTDICSTRTATQLGLLAFACPDGSADAVAAISSDEAMTAYIKASVLTPTIGNTCSNITSAPATPTTAPPSSTTPTSVGRIRVTATNVGNTAVGPLVASSVLVSAFASLGTTSRTSSLQFAVVGSVLRSRCMTVSASGGNSTDSSSSPVLSTAVENPTQIYVAGLADAVEYAGGTVIGNTVLVLGIGVVLHFAATVLRPWVKGWALPSSKLLPVVEFFGEAELPGTFVTIYSSLLTPTMSGAVLLLIPPSPSESASAGAVVLGVVGLIACAVLPVYLAWRFARARPCPVVSIGPSHNVVRVDDHQFVLRRAAAWLCRRDDVWTVSQRSSQQISDASGTTVSARTFARSYGAFIAPYRSGGRMWWYFVEIGIAVTGGIIGGITYGQEEDPCAAAVWSGALLATLSTGLVVLHVLIRPCNVMLDKWGAVFVGLLAAAADISAAAMDTDDVSSAFSIAAVAMELVFLLLAMCCSAIDKSKNVVQLENNTRKTVEPSKLFVAVPAVPAAVKRSPKDIPSAQQTRSSIGQMETFLRHASLDERLAAIISAITANTEHRKSFKSTSEERRHKIPSPMNPT